MSSPRALSDADLDALIGKLDLETKVRLLSGAGAWTTEAVPEIGLRTMTVSDGPVGVRGRHRHRARALGRAARRARRWPRPGTRSCCGRIGGLLAGEAVRKGVDVVLGPTINLHRSPLGGRHFECMSEDPLLTGRLATAYVRGVQEQGVGACPKHYVANDAETDRFTVDNRVDERTLRELYLAPFEAVVADADPWMVMAAYNGGQRRADDRERPARRAAEGRVGLRRRRRLRLGRRSTTASPRPGPRSTWPCPARRRSGASRWSRRCAAGRVTEAAIDAKVRRLLRLAARAGALDGVEPAGEARRRPDRGRRPAGPRGRGRGARCCCATTGSCRCRPTRCAGSPCSAPAPRTPARSAAGRRACRCPTWSRRSPGCGTRSTAGPRSSPPSVRRCPTRCAAPGPTSCPARTSGSPVVLRWLDADGATVAEQTAGHRHDHPAARRPSPTVPRSWRCTPASLPDEDGDWRLGVIGLGGACSRSTARPCSTRPRTPRSSTSTSLRLAAAARDVVRRWWPGSGSTCASGTAGPRTASSSASDSWWGRRLRPADEELAHAVELARTSDVAVVVVGTSDDVESEGFDRTSLALPGRQDELVRAVAAANPRTVVVVNAGAPVELPWRDEVSAVLVSWFPGMEFGNALADVLLGAVEPGGRLPTTWPAAMADAPVLDVTPDRRPARVRRGPRHRAPRLPGAPAPSRPTGSATASATRRGSTSRSRRRRGRRRADRHGPGAQHRRPARQAGRAGLRLAAGLGRRRARPAGWPASRSSRRAGEVVEVPVDVARPSAAALGRTGRAGPSSPGELTLVRSGRAPGDLAAPSTTVDAVSVSALPHGLRVEHLDEAARHPDDGAAAVLAAARRRPRAARLPDHRRQRLGHRLGRQRPEPAGALRRSAAGVRAAGRVAGARSRTDLGESPASEPAWFETGLLWTEDWQASWVEPGRHARRARRASGRRRCCGSSSTSTGPVVAARLHATAQGIYEAFLNGERVGDAELTPGFTQYDARLQVQTYDVTDVGPAGPQRARRRPRRRLVPRPDRHHPRRRPVGRPARAARPAAPRPRRRHASPSSAPGPGWRSAPGTSSPPT